MDVIVGQVVLVLVGVLVWVLVGVGVHTKVPPVGVFEGVEVRLDVGVLVGVKVIVATAVIVRESEFPPVAGYGRPKLVDTTPEAMGDNTYST